MVMPHMEAHKLGGLILSKVRKEYSLPKRLLASNDDDRAIAVRVSLLYGTSSPEELLQAVRGSKNPLLCAWSADSGPRHTARCNAWWRLYCQAIQLCAWRVR